MTLHCHKVDDGSLASDGMKPVHVPAGWQIATGDLDDIRVCGAHPGQSHGLIFSNGDYYGTAMHPFLFHIGTLPAAPRKFKFSHAL
jgi:hypothetical protein